MRRVASALPLSSARARRATASSGWANSVAKLSSPGRLVPCSRLISASARRVVHQPLPALAQQRDHQRRLPHRLDRARLERAVRHLHRRIGSIDQQRHPPVLERHAMQATVTLEGLALWIEGPPLAAHFAPRQRMAQVLQPLGRAQGSGVQVPCTERLEAFSPPEAQAGGIGPDHAHMIEIVDPHRTVNQREQAQRIAMARWQVRRLRRILPFRPVSVRAHMGFCLEPTI